MKKKDIFEKLRHEIELAAEDLDSGRIERATVQALIAIAHTLVAILEEAAVIEQDKSAKREDNVK